MLKGMVVKIQRVLILMLLTVVYVAAVGFTRALLSIFNRRLLKTPVNSPDSYFLDAKGYEINSSNLTRES